MMATKIKDTPIITGKDAEKFRHDKKLSEHQKISPEERSRIQANFDLLNVISKF